MNVFRFMNECRMLDNEIDKILYLFTKALQKFTNVTKRKYINMHLKHVIFNKLRKRNEVCVNFKNFKAIWPVIDLYMPPIYENGSFEPIIHKYFRPKKGEVVIDVGAYAGYYTITSALAVGDEGLVLAIEANPYTAGVLRRNVSLNKLKNIIVVNKALWDKQTTLKLRLAGDLLSGEDSLFGHGCRFVEVEATTLDHIISELGIDCVDWLKIDVEGAEYKVLLGAKQMIESNKDLHIFVETHTPALCNYVTSFLSLLGYTPHLRDRTHNLFLRK